ncbi:MAG: HEAT repeat domain-containing protein [Planctomycetes bacterium]|nr:HEAT repeat domain-containing protein [Planctomycetota bacterium]
MPARSRLLALFALSCAGLALAADDKLKDFEKALKDKRYGNYWNRLDACRSLGRIGSKDAAELLATVLADDQPEIRETATTALGGMSNKEALAWVASAPLFDPKEEWTRANAATALGMAKAVDQAERVARACTNDRSQIVRAAASRALAVMPGEESVKALITRMTDPQGEVRTAAAESLALLKAKGAFDALKGAADDRDPEARYAVLAALAAIDPKEAVELIKPALKAKEPLVRIGALEALVVADNPSADEALRMLLSDKEWQVRAAAARAAMEVRYKEDVEALILQLEKETGRLRMDFVVALRDLTGKEIGFDARDWKNWWEANKDGFKVAPKKGSKGLIEEDKPGDGAGASRASFFNIPILSDRLAFVIDMSGSMKTIEERKVEGEHTEDEELGTKLNLAKKELQATLRQLNEKIHFNISLMNTEFKEGKKRLFVKSLVPATEPNKTAAMKWFENAQEKFEKARRGRGDMYDAIVDALEDREVDTIFVLSDGVPTAGEHVVEEMIFEAVDRFNRSRRITFHCVLTGTRGTDKKFMESLAQRTGGFFVQR